LIILGHNEEKERRKSEAKKINQTEKRKKMEEKELKESDNKRRKEIEKELLRVPELPGSSWVDEEIARKFDALPLFEKSAEKKREITRAIFLDYNNRTKEQKLIQREKQELRKDREELNRQISERLQQTERQDKDSESSEEREVIERNELEEEEETGNSLSDNRFNDEELISSQDESIMLSQNTSDEN